MKGLTVSVLVAALAAWVALASMPARAAETFVFTSPPRGSQQTETQTYEPVAAYLSRVTGLQIVYKYPGNWLTYQADMRAGKYDLVFDGPAFAGWRMAHLGHVPLAKLPGNLVFVAFVKKDNDKIKSVGDLAGYPVCGMAPPNLATLTFYNQFSNPVRLPLVISVRSFKDAYKDVVSGKCAAAVMRTTAYDKLREHKDLTRAVFISKPVANQVFTAGPRFSPKAKQEITAALTSPQAETAIPAFLKRFNQGKPLVAASNVEYAGLDVLLNGVWGFDGQ